MIGITNSFEYNQSSSSSIHLSTTTASLRKNLFLSDAGDAVFIDDRNTITKFDQNRFDSNQGFAIRNEKTSVSVPAPATGLAMPPVLRVQVRAMGMQ